jgi:hypothetical protein
MQYTSSIGGIVKVLSSADQLTMMVHDGTVHAFISNREGILMSETTITGALPHGCPELIAAIHAAIVTHERAHQRWRASFHRRARAEHGRRVT